MFNNYGFPTPAGANFSTSGQFYPQYQVKGQQYDIIRVNGKNGAEALQMPPNSRLLVLDDTAPIVWLCQTDGAGYKTVQPYSITPVNTEPQTNLHDLEQRIAALEGKFNEQSNTSSNKRSKSTDDSK
jgi:hypothetical protein